MAYKCFKNLAPDSKTFTVFETQGLLNPEETGEGGNNDCSGNDDGGE
tara:strand:+ start:265 stop:405 length:141 start_codon:yes stop_codon:yes gene_type:complete